MEQANGTVLGFGSTLCAISYKIIPVESVVQAVVCSAIGAAVGFIVTYLLKKATLWLERKSR